MVYASKTFCFTRISSGSLNGETFGQVAHMAALKREILPRRWEAITSIECNPKWGSSLGYGRHIYTPSAIPASLKLYGYERTIWLQMYNVFNTMPGLSRVVLSNAYYGMNLEDVHSLLLALKGPFEIFDVDLNAYRGMSNDFKTELETARLRLIRT